MTRTSASIAVLAMVVLITGCAGNVRARLPHQPDDPTGTIVVILTQPARDLTVAVNGILVANRAHTKKLTIEGVPPGPAELVIAAGGGPSRIEHHIKVYVEYDQVVTIPVGSPEQSMTSAMHFGVLSVAAWVLSRAIYLAFL